MATYTENYSLVKPGYGDQADIDVLNRLMTDKVDALLFENRRISADEYDQTESYAVGDYAIFENVLYRCLEDTTGNFDPSKWEMTNLAKEVSTKGGADVTKTASGNPITFDDGASAPLVKCVTQITGSQDLHGYNKPWVGGAGKNKADISANTVSSSQTWNCTPTYSNNGVIATATGTYARIGYVIPVVSGQTITISLYALKSANTYGRIVFNSTEDWNNPEYGYKDTLESRTKHTITVTTTSNILFIGLYCTTTQSSGTLTVDSVMVEYSNQATDFAPYSNICPIMAYTEGEIEVGGENVLANEITTVTSHGVTFETLSNGYIEVTGKDTTNQDVYDVDVCENLSLPVGTYVVDCKGLAPHIFLQICNRAENQEFCAVTDTSGKQTLTVTDSNKNDMRARLYVYKGYDIDVTCLPTIRIATTHTTTYPSAIYRGSEDCVNGEVTEEWGMITATSTASFNNPGIVGAVNNFGRFAMDITDAVKFTNTSMLLCNEFDVIDFSKDESIWINPSRNCIVIGISAINGRFGIVVQNTATLSDLDSFLTSNPIEIAYELAAPTTSSVTPTNLPIKSLSGYTHIESSTGDMEVEYITEEFQPIIDLIESNKHVYSTAEQIVGTWIDGSVVYEKTYDRHLTPVAMNAYTWYVFATFSDPIKIIDAFGNDVDNGDISSSYPIVANYDNDELSVMHLRDSTEISLGYVTIRYTKSTPTRSLNLTKSAVEEIPEEIKNAEYEEKPEVNEADDDAPTEVDER